MNSSILLISLPDIFNGIGVNPLGQGNTSYFLWILMGFMLVTSVLVVSLGRVGDMYGRVRMYNLGFAIFTVFSILLAIPYWAPGGFSALPVPMVLLLGIAAAVAFVVGRRRRAKGWGTGLGERGKPD